MTKIYTVDALCGSGKTYAAIRYAIRCATFGEKVAIVQPSKDLIEQSYNDCVAVAEQQSAGIGIRRIDSSTSEAGQVKRDIISHLRNGDSRGEILFITHSAFLSMPYWHNAREWNVLFDELPVVDREFTRNLPATHGIGPNTYREYHLPGAIRVPADENFGHSIQKAIPDKSTPVIVYCLNHACTASPKAARKLDQLGYEKVYDYEAGKQDWKAAGLPVEGPP